MTRRCNPKFHTAGIDTHLTKMILQFLKRRKFRVKIEGKTSWMENMHRGGPTRISHLLMIFNIFTADIPKPEGTTLGLYTDDLAMLATDRNRELARRLLQKGVETLEEQYSKWKIKINPTKSKKIRITE